MSETKSELVEVNEKLYSVLPEELVEVLKKLAPIKLMSSSEVGQALGRSRQWLEWAMKKYPDLFPKPILDVNRYKGWLVTDVIHFRDNVMHTIAVETAPKKTSKK